MIFRNDRELENYLNMIDEARGWSLPPDNVVGIPPLPTSNLAFFDEGYLARADPKISVRDGRVLCPYEPFTKAHDLWWKGYHSGGKV